MGVRQMDKGRGVQKTDGQMRGCPTRRTDRLRAWVGAERTDRQQESMATCEGRTDGRRKDGCAGAARAAGARPRARAVAARAGGGGPASAVFVELSAAVEL